MLHVLSNIIFSTTPQFSSLSPCWKQKVELSDVKIKFTQLKESGLIPRSVCFQSSYSFHYPIYYLGEN